MRQGDTIMVTDGSGEQLEGVFVRKYLIGKEKLSIFQVKVQRGPNGGKTDWHLLEGRIV